MGKTGCPKCDYTGFAYGKIPCECTLPKAIIKRPEPPSETWAEFHGVPEIDTQVKQDEPVDGGNDFSPFGCMVRAGSPVYMNPDGSVTIRSNGTKMIGRINKIFNDGTVDVGLLYYGCYVKVKLQNNNQDIRKGDIIFYKNRLLGVAKSFIADAVMVEIALFTSFGSGRELEYGLIRVNRNEITNVIPGAET